MVISQESISAPRSLPRRSASGLSEFNGEQMSRNAVPFEFSRQRTLLAEYAAQRLLAGRCLSPVLARLRALTTAELLAQPSKPHWCCPQQVLEPLCRAVCTSVRRRAGWLDANWPEQALDDTPPPLTQTSSRSVQANPWQTAQTAVCRGCPWPSFLGCTGISASPALLQAATLAFFRMALQCGAKTVLFSLTADSACSPTQTDAHCFQLRLEFCGNRTLLFQHSDAAALLARLARESGGTALFCIGSKTAAVLHLPAQNRRQTRFDLFQAGQSTPAPATPFCDTPTEALLLNRFGLLRLYLAGWCAEDGEEEER